jgi:thiopurine S-methyltransferase
MDKNFWLEKWARSEIGFHEPGGNRFLQRWWPELAVPVGTTVLVPLCGKSTDMWWLRQRGYRVLGVELSEQAVQAFFEEHGLAPRTEQEGRFTRPRTSPLCRSAAPLSQSQGARVAYHAGLFACR